MGPEAHTCLHVLILFSFWRFSLSFSLSLSLFPVLALRFYLACLRYSSGRTNLVVQPTPLPAPLDTSRDLNSFYFPYISRFTTPFCHPPASYVSSNGFSPSFAPSSLPALLSQPPLLRRYAHPSSVLSCAALSSFIPYPTLLPTCVLSIARFSSRATLRRWETSLGLREDPLDRGRIPEEKHIRARVVSSK